VRRDAPFISVNCAALPEHLIESELFGHERGAFTGAQQQRKGRFELAHGGTLFLDEIGDISSAVQIRLLRVIQERTFERVGGDTPINVNVRIIAATNRNLEQAMQEGRFREDLYYRLNVFALHLPPLRERREDIPLLVDHFLARMNARMGLAVAGASPEAMRLLVEYDWPGNVRELENSIERAIVLCEGNQIESAALPERVRRGTGTPGVPIPAPVEDGDLSIKRASRRSEEALIRRALQRTRGNRTRAAELLEISHRALLYKIKEYGINVGRDVRDASSSEGSAETPPPVTPTPVTPTQGPSPTGDSTWRAK